ncbi:DUF4382 domain-containing protein [Muriicola sp. Z0-33]|uniref:DUF4382 domain-containing protein n=1 Tax=Muriicola sp. Z0-33 TaxID=2816957 RepID=UPI002238DF35|nr:DUF4382 domain-containing protein [Muriicola sp. Z0-33]MCW5515283.1 DUF4382 domain-containing protein [Muriicola sp. Z0-33]
MKIKSLMLFLLAAMVMISCSNENDGPEMGKLIVQLTDAPFPTDDVAEANVTIFKVEVRYKGDKSEGEMPEEEGAKSEENGFIIVSEEEKEVNLLELTNGVTETLVNTEVPAGSYDLIRVYVKGVNVVLKEGTEYNLKVPSGDATGIKIFIKPELVVDGGLTSDLLLDFDVSRSFVPKGSADAITGFNFKPIIKASNMTIAGTLTGLVTETIEDVVTAVEGAQVTVYNGEEVITSTFTDAEGGYAIMGLDAGTYSITIEKEGYEMQSLENIVIIAGNKTQQNTELALVAP